MEIHNQTVGPLETRTRKLIYCASNPIAKSRKPKSIKETRINETIRNLSKRIASIHQSRLCLDCFIAFSLSPSCSQDRFLSLAFFQPRIHRHPIHCAVQGLIDCFYTQLWSSYSRFVILKPTSSYLQQFSASCPLQLHARTGGHCSAGLSRITGS